MPINVTCPNCHAVAEVPDSAAGARGKCRACGETVRVPARHVAKHCVVCSVDVARLPRTKDAQGNYYCQSCYEVQTANSDPNVTDAVSLDALAAAVAQSSQTSGGAKQTDNNWFTCPICHSQVTQVRMDGSGICIDCARGSTSRSGHGKRTQPNTSGVRKILFRTSVVVIALFIALASFVALRVYLREQAFQERMRASDEEYAQQSARSSQALDMPKAVAIDPEEESIRSSLLFYAKLARDIESGKSGAQLHREKADAYYAKGQLAEGNLEMQSQNAVLQANLAAINVQNATSDRLRKLGGQRVLPVRDRLLEDPKTPTEYRLILFELRIPDTSATPTIDAPLNASTAATPFKLTNPSIYGNREYTDTLIVIEHSATVAERQFSGFFPDSNPRDVFMRQNLRLARNYFGRQDVFCIHPWSERQPATADFSQITLQGAGTIVFNLHNLFDPKSGQAGDCKVTFIKDGTEFQTSIVEGNEWHWIAIPFDRSQISLTVSATGWFWEHAFLTYDVLRPSVEPTELKTLAIKPIEARNAGAQANNSAPAGTSRPVPAGKQAVATINDQIVPLIVDYVNSDIDYENAKGQVEKLTTAGRREDAIRAQEVVVASGRRSSAALASLNNQNPELVDIALAVLLKRDDTTPAVRVRLTQLKQLFADKQQRAPAAHQAEGAAQPQSFATCPSCGGSGRKSQREIDYERSAAMQQALVSPGVKRITIDPNCPRCDGSGQVEVRR